VALLRGLIFGPDGRAMTPHHARKEGRCCRYYVSMLTIKRGCGQLVEAAPPGSMHIAIVMRAGAGGRQIVRRDIASARVDRSLMKAIAWARDLRQRLERDGKSG